LNIFAVDDEAVTLNRVKYYLKKWGYNILTAGNGVEALEKFLSEKVDIILTDRIIRQTQEKTICRLLSALEARDKETGGHARRIGLYSARLAKAAGWTQDQIDDILIAASMHDIGKIGVSDLILRKKGRLTKSEFEIIKSHTIIGGRILGNSKLPMLHMAHDIALCHHEKWDGSGYPCGLIGEQIPEAACIVALVDVYDALVQGRIYRKALSEEEVLAKMYGERESHFKPDLFNIFTELIPELRDIARNNP
jgi:putative two-component system response regulator